ncbi:hypothetical protein [Brevundimonas sp. SL130]|uniref:hypothetical protein n=1 Tax=Brevundimonas sp. SL130 TaxID=2995143 RepID=UPI00226C764C|nr:hypothetical protein [Brevundimonas sp. SL130]WAC59425.1 hypothetical protein OU998_14585 [Brevundimonas sp. SL130]
MGLRYENLDAETRTLMSEEIDMDRQEQSMYVSNHLNDRGAELWPELTSEAAKTGTDDSLARALTDQNLLKDRVERRTPSGGTTMAKVPYTAPSTLAEAQFNMYYMRALARRAISTGSPLVVYRGKEVTYARPESEKLLGTHFDPQVLLDELRRTKGVDPAIPMPLPNSGLCVRL